MEAWGPVLCLLGLCFISVLFSCSVLHSHTALANLPNEPQELHNNNNNNSYYTSTANRKHIGDALNTHKHTSPSAVSSWQLWSDTSKPQGWRSNGQRHNISQIIWQSKSRVNWKKREIWISEEMPMKTWTMSHHFIYNKAKMNLNNNLNPMENLWSVLNNVLLNLLKITQKCILGCKTIPLRQH